MVDRKHPPRDRELGRLAARQHGIVSLAQLEALGLSRAAVAKRAGTGRLYRVYRGVYAVGHRRLADRGHWLAAVLACGETAVLSHGAALAAWELRPRPAGALDVTVVGRGRRSPHGIRLHSVRVLDTRDRTAVDAVPVTTVARSLLDYAEIADAQQLRLAVEAAERRELLDVPEIDELLRRSPGRRGCTKLKTALAQLTGPMPWTRSELERQFLALVREYGFPEPQCNVLVEGHLVDFYWPRARVVAEVDGFAFHRGRAQFERDHRRDAALVVARISVVRFTQRRIATERAQVGEELRRLLE